MRAAPDLEGASRRRDGASRLPEAAIDVFLAALQKRPPGGGRTLPGVNAGRGICSRFAP